MAKGMKEEKPRVSDEVIRASRAEERAARARLIVASDIPAAGSLPHREDYPTEAEARAHLRAGWYYPPVGNPIHLRGETLYSIFKWVGDPKKCPGKLVAEGDKNG